MSSSHSNLAYSNDQNQSQAVVRRTHAPEYSGFTHTIETRFTYFAGSEGSTRTSFGMPANDLAKLMTKFSKDFYASEAAILAKNRISPPVPETLKLKLNTCVGEINDFADKLKRKTIYKDLSVMIVALSKTGHIPLILTKATSAAQYERSTRSLGANDLEQYYKLYPGAQAQAIEYLVKQGMMQKVAELYRDISALRNTLPEGKPDYIACTRLMTKLNKEVIEVNEATLPSEYVQFDLYYPFIEKLRVMICQINLGLVEKNVIDSLINAINLVTHEATTVTNQKNVSEFLYRILKDFFEKKGFGDDELTIDKELDAVIQEILPIAAYLNSQFNPFSQDGVFGTVVTGSFHQKALEAYRLHESKHLVRNPYSHNPAHEYKYTPITRTEEYNTDQMEQIVFGEIVAPDQIPKPSITQSLFSSMTSALLKITDGSEVKTVATSESRQRRQQAALPAPPVQLLLEEEKKSNTGLRR
jgi:hypothetical protein